MTFREDPPAKKCGGRSHADCPNHEPHADWCYEDESQCGDKDCKCHELWAENAPDPPW